MLTPTDLQRQTLRLYGELISQRPHWGGQLVFTSGIGSSATGLPAAVSIAGGATLALDPDAATVKTVFRQGGIDFVVNTLDEALRVLKNEIRQHKPLSVGLIAPLQPVLDEMASRGVLPDLAVHFQLPKEDSLDQPSPPQLSSPQLSKGNGFSRAINTPESDRALAPEADQPHLPARAQIQISEQGTTPSLTPWLTRNDYTEVILPAGSTVGLRALDLQLLDLLPPEDNLRRRWLQRIPHYQRPSTPPARVLWLTPTELDVFKISAKVASPDTLKTP